MSAQGNITVKPWLREESLCVRLGVPDFQARYMPLNRAFMVGDTGFEPVTSSV